MAPVYRSKNEGLGGVAVLYAAKASLSDALLGARTGSLVFTCQVYSDIQTGDQGFRVTVCMALLNISIRLYLIVPYV